MTGTRPGRPARPVMIPQIACLADDGGYVAPAGSQAAYALAGLPALRKAHDPAAVGPPTGEDVAELVRAAGEHARAAGWVRRADGRWLCPAHTDTYADTGRDPKHFTIRECLHRHRTRARG